MTPPASTTPSSSVAPTSSDSSPLFLFSLAVSTGPTLHLDVGESQILYLNVSLSDGSVYRGITKTLNTPHDDLDADVIWYSHDESVATISPSGKITAVAEGSTLLTVHLGNKSTQVSVQVETAEAEIELTEMAFPEPIFEPNNDPETTSEEYVMESLSIMMDETEFEIGEEKTLTCDLFFNTGSMSGVNHSFVLPSGDVGEINWQSSDEEVVSIIEDSHEVIKAKFVSYGSATLTAVYSDVSDDVTVDSKMKTQEAKDSDDYFISSDDDLEDHFAADGGYGLSSFPKIVYGMPENSLLDVVSFGTKGKLIIGFNHYVIVDGLGDDFTVFENVFDGWTEAAKVLVSDDDITYHEFPCDAFGSGEGCAGVTAVNYSSSSDDMRDPEISGGDSFDLAELGLSRVRYVKIVDQGTCVEDGFLCTSDTIGFDLDALAIVNGENE